MSGARPGLQCSSFVLLSSQRSLNLLTIRTYGWLVLVAVICPHVSWARHRLRRLLRSESSKATATSAPCCTPVRSTTTPRSKTYTITGSGENMWSAADAFQFVWKKISGDVTLTADICFLTKTGNEHKKAVLMLRQSLDAIPSTPTSRCTPAA